MLPKLKLKIKFSSARRWVAFHDRLLLLIILFAILVSYLLVHRLTTLPTANLSASEHLLSITPIGWHGLVQNPFFFIHKLQLSVGYYLFGQGGALVTRLPSVKLGALAIICVAVLMRAWHGTRIAVLGCLLFACSAWTLHVSRYANFDSAYLAAIPMLLVSQLALQRAKARWVPYLVLSVWSLLLFTPGLIWFVLLAAWWERDSLVLAWQQQKHWWQRLLLFLAGLAWLPLLLQFFIKQPQQVVQWLGAPEHLANPSTLLHQLAAVPLHLFGHGPAIPELWLGQLPVLDIFSLTVTVLGIIYYARHWQSGRSRLLLSYALISSLVIALGGAASLSLIVPLAYLAAAAGLSSFLRDWLRRFPFNPIIRFAGIIALSLVVLASCAYNLQSYFVAWPHNFSTIRHFASK